MAGNGQGRIIGAQPQVVGMQAHAPERHRMEVEELHGHLANEHGCGHAQQLVQLWVQERVERASRFAVPMPDGTARLDLNIGELIAEPANRRAIEQLHREHHQYLGGYESVGVAPHGPAVLHRWEDQDG